MPTLVIVASNCPTVQKVPGPFDPFLKLLSTGQNINANPTGKLGSFLDSSSPSGTTPVNDCFLLTLPPRTSQPFVGDPVLAPWLFMSLPGNPSSPQASPSLTPPDHVSCLLTPSTPPHTRASAAHAHSLGLPSPFSTSHHRLWAPGGQGCPVISSAFNPEWPSVNAHTTGWRKPNGNLKSIPLMKEEPKGPVLTPGKGHSLRKFSP